MPTPILLRRFVDLGVCMAIAVVMVASALASFGGPLLVVLGSLLVLLVPGYCIACTIWDSESDMTLADRVAFSVGLSAALSIFTVLALSVFGLGILPLTVVVALGYESLIFSVLAISFRWARRQGIPHEMVEAFVRSKKVVGADRFFWAIVSVLLVAAAILIFMTATVPKPNLATQLYLLGPDGTASSLPQTIVANQSVSFIVGVQSGLVESFPFTVTVCLLPTNGTCSTTPFLVANWSALLVVAPNGTYALSLTVGGGLSTQATLHFTVPVPGDYVLSVALDGGGVHREARLPLTVTP